MTLNQISALHRFPNRFPRTLWKDIIKGIIIKVIIKGIIIKVIIKVIKPISYHEPPLGTVRNLSQHKWELWRHAHLFSLTYI